MGFHTSGLFAALIRFGQRLAKVQNWDVTHIAIVSTVLPNGDAEAIQAVKHVNEVFLSSYGNTPHVVIPFPGTDDRRGDVVLFARSAVGRKYGVASVISRAINTLTPKFISFTRGGDCDCSTLGARAWEHGGIVLPAFDSTQIEPGQLCDWYLPKESVVAVP